MIRADVKFKFCFPTVNNKVQTTEDYVKALITLMQKNGSIDYAGYMEDADLEKDLISRIGEFDAATYRRLSTEQKEKIETAVVKTIEKCDRVLAYKDLPIYIFVFPWFPSPKDSKLFGGVTAVAPHTNVIHIFVDPLKHTLTSVKETVAHEYNHLLFYTMQPAKSYTLLQHMLMEGLAEDFREEVVGGKQAPWATALNRTEAHKHLETLRTKLLSKGEQIRQDVLLGNKTYPRWTGYSIGYHLVKDLRKRKPRLTWAEIMRTKAPSYLP